MHRYILHFPSCGFERTRMIFADTLDEAIDILYTTTNVDRPDEILGQEL